MKHCLLLLGIVAVLAMGAPAYSQYIYMDVNNSGTCTTTDVLTPSSVAVDVWLDTNHGATGTLATCSDGVNPLNMFGYGLIMNASGAGTVTYTGWTNALASFTILEAFRTSGSAASVSYSAPLGTTLSPGLYKLGTMAVTVTGDPVLSFLANNSSLGGVGTPYSGFGSDCSGTDFPNTIALGTDYNESCGTSTGTPTQSTTWGYIKNLYR